MDFLWLVHEDTIIWAAFTRHKDALAFRKREFTEGYVPSVSRLPIYQSLADAPASQGGLLKEALAL
jgi:hypothetical protein